MLLLWTFCLITDDASERGWLVLPPFLSIDLLQCMAACANVVGQRGQYASEQRSHSQKAHNRRLKCTSEVYYE